MDDTQPPVEAKLLDDLFRRTKASPSIYWLPLTDEQVFCFLILTNLLFNFTDLDIVIALAYIKK